MQIPIVKSTSQHNYYSIQRMQMETPGSKVKDLEDPGARGRVGGGGCGGGRWRLASRRGRQFGGGTAPLLHEPSLIANLCAPGPQPVSTEGPVYPFASNSILPQFQLSQITFLFYINAFEVWIMELGTQIEGSLSLQICAYCCVMRWKLVWNSLYFERGLIRLN